MKTCIIQVVGSQAFSSLSIYFFKHFLTSVGFLITFVLAWSVGSKIHGRATGLTYVYTGSLIGFLGQLLGGFLGAYIYKLPILPLILHRQGVSSQEIARMIAIYNLGFEAFYFLSLITALVLMGYGIRKLVNTLKKI